MLYLQSGHIIVLLDKDIEIQIIIENGSYAFTWFNF